MSTNLKDKEMIITLMNWNSMKMLRLEESIGNSSSVSVEISNGKEIERLRKRNLELAEEVNDLNQRA